MHCSAYKDKVININVETYEIFICFADLVKEVQSGNDVYWSFGDLAKAYNRVNRETLS